MKKILTYFVIVFLASGCTVQLYPPEQKEKPVIINNEPDGEMVPKEYSSRPRFWWEQIEQSDSTYSFAITDGSNNGQWLDSMRWLPNGPYITINGDTVATLGDLDGNDIDSTRLTQDSILVYYLNGSETGRDTIAGSGGGSQDMFSYFTGSGGPLFFAAEPDNVQDTLKLISADNSLSIWGGNDNATYGDYMTITINEVDWGDLVPSVQDSIQHYRGISATDATLSGTGDSWNALKVDTSVIASLPALQDTASMLRTDLARLSVEDTKESIAPTYAEPTPPTRPETFDYYIDPVGGNDASAGTSRTAAFETSTPMNTLISSWSGVDTVDILLMEGTHTGGLYTTSNIGTYTVFRFWTQGNVVIDRNLSTSGTDSGVACGGTNNEFQVIGPIIIRDISNNAFSTFDDAKSYIWNATIINADDGLSAHSTSELNAINVTISDCRKYGIAHVSTSDSYHWRVTTTGKNGATGGLSLIATGSSGYFYDCVFLPPAGSSSKGPESVSPGISLYENCYIGMDTMTGTWDNYLQLETTTLSHCYINAKVSFYLNSVFDHCYGTLTIRPRGPQSDTLTVKNCVFADAYENDRLLNMNYYNYPSDAGGVIIFQDNIFKDFNQTYWATTAAAGAYVDSTYIFRNNVLYNNTTNYTNITNPGTDITTDPVLYTTSPTSRNYYEYTHGSTSSAVNAGWNGGDCGLGQTYSNFVTYTAALDENGNVKLLRNNSSSELQDTAAALRIDLAPDGVGMESFTISSPDGFFTQTITDGESINFQAGDGLSPFVSSGDVITYSLSFSSLDTLTSFSLGDRIATWESFSAGEKTLTGHVLRAWVESIATGSDNLGNHTMTQNLQTGGNYVTNDGDNEGITIGTDGGVRIWNNTPNTIARFEEDPDGHAAAAVGVDAPANERYSLTVSDIYDYTTSGSMGGILVSSTFEPTSTSGGGLVGFNVTNVSKGSFSGSYNTGFQSAVNHTGSSNMSVMRGAFMSVSNNSSSTIGTAYGLDLQMNQSGAGSISNTYGIYIPTITGTHGTFHGIRVLGSTPSGFGAAFRGGMSAGASKYNLYMDGDADNYLRGDVGINVTVPSQALHVDGNVRITGKLYDGSNSTGTAGQILSYDGVDLDWIDAPTGGGGTMSSWTWGGDVSTVAINDGDQARVNGAAGLEATLSTNTVTIDYDFTAMPLMSNGQIASNDLLVVYDADDAVNRYKRLAPLNFVVPGIESSAQIVLNGVSAEPAGSEGGLFFDTDDDRVKMYNQTDAEWQIIPTQNDVPANFTGFTEYTTTTTISPSAGDVIFTDAAEGAANMTLTINPVNLSAGDRIIITVNGDATYDTTIATSGAQVFYSGDIDATTSTLFFTGLNQNNQFYIIYDGTDFFSLEHFN